MKRGLGCLTVLSLVVVSLLGLLVWWLGWPPVAVGILVVTAGVGLLCLVLSHKGYYLRTSAPPRHHPGKRIGVRSPESGVVVRVQTEEYPSIVETVELVEQDDAVVRRVVETVALLRADGVPRDFLRVPDEEFTDEAAWRVGFAVPDVDAVLDRLCEAGLLGADGDRVVMDPTVALAVRLRAEDAERVQDVTGGVGDLLYAHALSVRSHANRIFFDRGDPSDSAAIVERVRALLDQAVTLAWHTRYTYDRAMDTILQCNASLVELGQLDDAFVLAKQMATLCRQRFGAAHPMSYEAAESVRVIRQTRQSGGSR